MDYWTRIIIATMIGLGIGLTVGYFYGDQVFWVLICLAFSLATETVLRTMRNIKPSSEPSIVKNRSKDSANNRYLPRKKPPKPNF